MRRARWGRDVIELASQKGREAIEKGRKLAE